MALRHIISTRQFLSKEVLQDIFKNAAGMEARDHSKELTHTCQGKILATVFYEPSTRTRFSFETAMHKLGGDVITSESAGQFSSASKGETLPDAMRVISGYADAIVLRHPMEGAAKIAAESSLVPIISAGDGSGEHPTQAILDLYTIQKELGRIDDLTVALIGDLLYGRTVHSLLYLFSVFSNIHILLVSPPQLRLPEKYKEYLRQNKISFEELDDVQGAAKKADVLYVTRIQRERFLNPEEYEKLKDSYSIGSGVLAVMKNEAAIMHPLPRVNEIAPEVDSDIRAAYFRQTKNGVYVRMALLKSVME